MKLLIVDDSQIIRKAIGAYLGKMNLEVAGQAGDGEEALRLFRETRPEAVTMDITMPGMDGLECMRHILEINPDTRVLVITALNDNLTAVKALNSGARGFLGKPFTQAGLAEAVQKLLED